MAAANNPGATTTSNTVVNLYDPTGLILISQGVLPALTVIPNIIRSGVNPPNHYLFNAVVTSGNLTYLQYIQQTLGTLINVFP